jgi:hypothetical protein
MLNVVNPNPFGMGIDKPNVRLVIALASLLVKRGLRTVNISF